MSHSPPAGGPDPPPPPLDPGPAAGAPEEGEYLHWLYAKARWQLKSVRGRKWVKSVRFRRDALREIIEHQDYLLNEARWYAEHPWIHSTASDGGRSLRVRKAEEMPWKATTRST